jgi:hypothetical protein
MAQEETEFVKPLSSVYYCRDWQTPDTFELWTEAKFRNEAAPVI